MKGSGRKFLEMVGKSVDMVVYTTKNAFGKKWEVRGSRRKSTEEGGKFVEVVGTQRKSEDAFGNK